MIRAFVDESESNRALDPHAYLLGAAVVFDEHVDDVREAIANLRLARQRKLHWRDESTSRQLAMVSTLADLPIEAVLVAHVDEKRASEARRRRTLAALLEELHGLGVDRVDLESRGPADDRRDRRLLESLQRSRRIDTTVQPLRMFHPTGPSEPCLWVADAICGAVVARRTGDSQFTDVLGSRLREIPCP